MAVKTIGDQLRYAREQRDLTQEDAAAALGVSVTSIRNWERDRKTPEPFRHPAIADLLGIKLIPQVLDLPRLRETAEFILGLYQDHKWIDSRVDKRDVTDDIIDLYLEGIDEKADFEQLKAEHAKVVNLQLARLARR